MFTKVIFLSNIHVATDSYGVLSHFKIQSICTNFSEQVVLIKNMSTLINNVFYYNKMAF